MGSGQAAEPQNCARPEEEDLRRERGLHAAEPTWGAPTGAAVLEAQPPKRILSGPHGGQGCVTRDGDELMAENVLVTFGVSSKMHEHSPGSPGLTWTPRSQIPFPSPQEPVHLDATPLT